MLKKLRYGLLIDNDFVFLAGNGLLGKLNMNTGQVLILDKGLYKLERFVAIAGAYKIIFDNGAIFDLSRNRKTGRLPNFKDGYHLWDYNSSKHLFLVEYLRDVLIIDSDTNAVLKEFTARHFIDSLTMSSDGDLIVALSNVVKRLGVDKQFSDIQIWTLSAGDYFHTVPSFSSLKVSLDLNSDGTLLAVAGDGRIILYSVVNNKKTLEHKLNDKTVSNINALAFIANDKLLVASLTDEMLILDVETGNYIYIPLSAKEPKSKINIENLSYLPERNELIGIDKTNAKLYRWKL